MSLERSMCANSALGSLADTLPIGDFMEAYNRGRFQRQGPFAESSCRFSCSFDNSGAHSWLVHSVAKREPKLCVPPVYRSTHRGHRRSIWLSGYSRVRCADLSPSETQVRSFASDMLCCWRIHCLPAAIVVGFAEIPQRRPKRVRNPWVCLVGYFGSSRRHYLLGCRLFQRETSTVRYLNLRLVTPRTVRLRRAELAS